MTNTETTNDAVYFLSLSLENVRCFGSRQTLDLSDGNGNYAPWTVILGDNGTGKTTLLQVLAGITPINLGISKAGQPQNSPYIFFHYYLNYTNSGISKIIRGKNKKSRIDLEYIDTRLPASQPSEHYYLDFEISQSQISVFNDNYSSFPTKHNIYAYGANRRPGTNSLSQQPLPYNIKNIFNDQIELLNAEEWLLQEDYKSSKSSKIQPRFDLVKDVLINILPDVVDIRVSSPDTDNPNPRAEFKTPDGWLKLDALSLGYQTMIAWMVDLAAHLFQRYPDSENPIAEPAVVLIDEIDLHLHPKWQRTIMSYLSERFTNTQFIVTAHSPLIVQAAENANIVVLKREGDEVHIHQHKDAVRGWRIDQILNSDLFEEIGTRSPHYEQLLQERQKILSKTRLTKADKAKLQALEAEIGDLPTAETPADIKAMDIIRRAAEILKSQP